MQAMEIVTEDGTVIGAPSELQVAWKWAEHTMGDEWERMDREQRSAAVAIAYDKLMEGQPGYRPWQPR